MERSIYRFSLDIRDSFGACQPEMKQGDTHRRLCVNLTDGGVPYPISDGCRVVFTAKKPDGTVIYNTCTVEDDTVIYDVTPQTTAEAGLLSCELQLYDALAQPLELITSASFGIRVHPRVYNESDTPASETESTGLSAVMQQAEQTVAEMKALRGEVLGMAGDAAESVLAVTSQGRSAKYYVTSPGWKRVLNIIRGTAGTLSAGLAKSRAAGGYSCQTMAVNLSGYVYFPGKKLPKKQPVLYQLFNNEFGENDSDDAGRRARITQVRIGYPADGTDYPDSDGAINYATNPVNCYVDVYVDFVPQFDGDRCQLNLNFAGFADSHNCEPITEETDASDTGIYGEELEYHTLQLKKDAELYLPDGSVEAKEIRAANMPFFKLEGTAEHPVTLKSLADGVYYISGMGNYSGKETVKTLNTGVYMVRQFTSYASVLFLQITTVHRLRWYKITASGYEEKLIELDDIAAHGERIATLEADLAKALERIEMLENGMYFFE